MNTSSAPTLFEFQKIGNSSLGYISIAENKSLPFEVKRVYWTYFTPHEVIRGQHAHRDLQQILIAVSGTIEVETEMRNGSIDKFVLNKPNQGLYIPPYCWRVLRFSHNGVLLCLASMAFHEDDYIRDYSTFKEVQ